MNTYTATTPDGQLIKRTSKHTYTHAVLAYRGGVWSASFSTRYELAKADAIKTAKISLNMGGFERVLLVEVAA
jgi:hypothetical protein